MIELLLIRHGETDWNVARRLQGNMDIGLNDNGRQQARALAMALRDEALDVIVSSDLQRAVQTAQEIATLQNLPCQINPQWRERSFGGFEGELISTLEQRYPAEYAAWRAHEPDSQFPANAQGVFSGETIRQFTARIDTALKDLSAHHAGKKIAVIAHGGVLECAYRIAMQLPLNAPREVTMKNASINRFELSTSQNQHHFRLVQWGDISHLDTALDEITR